MNSLTDFPQLLAHLTQAGIKVTWLLTYPKLHFNILVFSLRMKIQNTTLREFIYTYAEKVTLQYTCLSKQLHEKYLLIKFVTETLKTK